MAFAVTSTPATVCAPTAAYTATFVASGYTGAITWEFFGLPSDFVPTVVDDHTVTITAAAGATHPAGTYAITVKGTDAAAATASKSYTLYVATPLGTTGTLPANGAVSLPYAGKVYPTGGVAPYTFALVAGTLPTNLTLSTSTGIVSGTPSTSQTKTGIQIRITDAAGQTATSLAMNVVIDASGSAEALTIQAQNTFPGKVGTAYVMSSKAGGGSGTGYAYSVSSGALPAGVTLSSSSGLVSGSPNAGAEGTYSGIVFRVTDSLGATADVALDTFVIGPSGTALTISSPADSAPSTGGGYSQKFTGTGGTGSGYVYSKISGAFPPGVTLNTATGLVSGTVTTPGAYAYTIRVTDSGSHVADSRSVSVTVKTAWRRSRGAPFLLYA
ncbi:MAG: hypothetical protein JWO56_2843 [Acidobacteria bacterium]|nr:hypothetical protein [Acidobacteriota bacterium]